MTHQLSGGQELDEAAALEESESPDQLKLKEGDMVDKLRVMEKFLSYWLPELVKGGSRLNQVAASE